MATLNIFHVFAKNDEFRIQRTELLQYYPVSQKKNLCINTSVQGHAWYTDAPVMVDLVTTQSNPSTMIT